MAHVIFAPVNIFLSYTRKKDQFQKVTAFRERFELEVEMRVPGSRVFQDTQHMLDGQHFPEVLETELRNADVLLALVSPSWLQSDWCRREFLLFTDDATDNARLHRILPVLWVDTPDMHVRSLDVVARTMAKINYSDWRDLRFESWDDPKNQRQLGKLAESAAALVQASPTSTNQVIEQAGEAMPERLSEKKERLLLALNSATDGLPEDRLAQLAVVGPAGASVYLHELQSEGYVRPRLRVGQRVNHWLISVPGQAYLVQHGLAV